MTTDAMTLRPANAAAERFAAAVDRATTGADGSGEWATELGIVAMLRVTGPRLAVGAGGSKERIRRRLSAALLAERPEGAHVDIRARQTTREVSLDAGVPVA